MSVHYSKAAPHAQGLLDKVKDKHHQHLEFAEIALAFADSKPFSSNRLNLGKLSRFSKAAQLWHTKPYDFCVTLCTDVWFKMLNDAQREALLDLHMSRCQVQYEPQVVKEGNRKQIVKDEVGRIQYTDIIKYDEDGRPRWRIVPMDIYVFSDNASRYGLWFDGLVEFKQVISDE